MPYLPRLLLAQLALLLLGAAPPAFAQAQAQTPAPAPSPAPAATPAPPRAPGGCLTDPASQEKYCPGWRVQVFAIQKDRQSLVGRFVAKQPSHLSMRDHLATVDFDGTNMLYKGEAFYNAAKDGEYSFIVEQRLPRDTGCETTLMAGNDVVAQTRDSAVPVAGSTALQAGLHRLEFDFRCDLASNAEARSKNPPVLIMRVLAEGEDAPREFRDGELYHKEQ